MTLSGLKIICHRAHRGHRVKNRDSSVFSVANFTLSMPEVAHIGKYHGDIMFIGSGDDFFVPH